MLQPVIFDTIFHSLSIKRLLNLDMAKEKERKMMFWRSYKQMRKADQFAESPIYSWTAGPISAIFVANEAQSSSPEPFWAIEVNFQSL